MKAISVIVMQLKNRQAQVERKINQLIDQNLDPFPFERLEKGKKLNKLIQKILRAIEGDDLILAGMHIQIAGLKLDL